MTYSYQRWADFGPEGISPNEITLDYHPERKYTLSSKTTEAVTETWTALIDTDEELFDAPSFNLCGVTGLRLQLGPTRFRDHRVRRALLSSDDRVPRTYSESVTEELHDAIHLLSSFVAVVANGHLCLGIKPEGPEDAPFLSLPGSGYLDRDLDMEDDTVKSTEQVIGRELHEELGLRLNDASVRCLGVFEDTALDSHLNPALFSVVETEQTPEMVRERARTAPDRDEFTDLAFLPIEGDVLSALVARALPSESQGRLPATLPFDDVGRLSHKTLLMLLLLGRAFEGTAWFENQWSRFDAYTFEPTVK
mgnify:CR=1 FL=1